MNIYIANLSFEVTDEDLRELFSPYGTINSVKVINDKETGKSKGFGFVEMPNDEEGQAAIDALNGQTILFDDDTEASEGKEIKVSIARPRQQNNQGNFRQQNNGFQQRRQFNNNGGFRQQNNGGFRPRRQYNNYNNGGYNNYNNGGYNNNYNNHGYNNQEGQDNYRPYNNQPQTTPETPAGENNTAE